MATNNSDVWMSPEELEAWRKNRQAQREPKNSVTLASDNGTVVVKKRSPNQLALALLGAAETGNVNVAMEAVRDGAVVNCRARAQPMNSPLTLALTHGHDELGLALMLAGAWPAPPRYHYNKERDKVSHAFDESVKKGFSKDEVKELGLEAMNLFIKHGKSWDIMRSARDHAAPTMSDETLMGHLSQKMRHDVLLLAVKAGFPMTKKVWSQSLGSGLWRGWNLKNYAHFKALLELIANPISSQELSAELVERMFSCVINHDNSELLLVLLDRGLRPSKDWSIEAQWHNGAPKDDLARTSLLTAAASLERSDLFDLIKSHPMLIDACKNLPESPWSLAKLSVSRLLEVRDLGVDIGGSDSLGRSLMHVWAMVDYEPRDGWASMAHKAPEIFDARDTRGRQGASLMAEKLKGEAKDSFLAAISRIEVREIKKDIGKPQPKAAAAPSRRL